MINKFCLWWLTRKYEYKDEPLVNWLRCEVFERRFLLEEQRRLLEAVKIISEIGGET